MVNISKIKRGCAFKDCRWGEGACLGRSEPWGRETAADLQPTPHTLNRASIGASIGEWVD